MEIAIKEIQDFLKSNETKLKFKKLVKKGYYYFDGLDKNQESFYVNFESVKYPGKFNFKKIQINEVAELFNASLKERIIKRSDFDRICKNTFKSGPCGFAVLISLLEQMGKGKYLGHGKGFEIKNNG